MRIALITGASSGLGRQYAHWCADHKAADEIWAIARRQERLEELKSELSCPVRPIPLDLADTKSLDELEHMLAEEKAKDPSFEVSLLVNAAGFGKFGTYADMTREEVDKMVDLNCRAVVDMTQIALPYMGKGGHIIQIASSASFQPLPGLNVYAASKAFVRSYTRALRFELRGKGIFVTAVCPLWVKTEFIKVARDTKNGHTVNHPFPQLSAAHVVNWSMFVNRINYPIATCCITGFIMRIADKILPAPLIMWAWEGLRRI